MNTYFVLLLRINIFIITLYYYVYAIVVYYCIFQAMYGQSLINDCLLSNFIRAMRPTLNEGIWIIAGSVICY